MTKAELARRSDLTPMAITNYESGARKPDMEVLKRLAAALDIRVSDFLSSGSDQLVFSHGDFRKTSTLPALKQEYVRESVEDYLSRFYTVVEILGGPVLPDPPERHALPLSRDAEQDARALRLHLGIAEDGPVKDLTGILEDRGILVYLCDVDSKKFSGMNGTVNARPYIIANACMSPERVRSTLAHELAHLFFDWPDDMEHRETEAAATAIGGAFLFPRDDAVRELGPHRNGITNDMALVCREYGISMLLLAKRAEQLHIVSKEASKQFFIRASALGWRTNEPSRIEPERPVLFEQLVFRAIGEGEISMQRGAELLKMPYQEVVSHCCFDGG